MQKLFKQMSKLFERMSEPFKWMSQNFKQTLIYFKPICKPFEQFFKCFEQSFCGLQTDNERISVRFAFHGHTCIVLMTLVRLCLSAQHSVAAKVQKENNYLWWAIQMSCVWVFQHQSCESQHVVYQAPTFNLQVTQKSINTLKVLPNPTNSNCSPFNYSKWLTSYFSP